jgi:hypothetical protein
MVLYVPHKDIIDFLGSDGVGAHLREMQEFALSLGKCFVDLYRRPEFVGGSCCWTEEEAEQHWSANLDGNVGRLCNERQAEAWDGKQVYDPKGFMYGIESMEPAPYIFCMLVHQISEPHIKLLF